MVWRLWRRSRHSLHKADARRWRRATRGRDWHLAGVSRQRGTRVYVWVLRLPSGGYRYVALAGLRGSVAMLRYLRAAQQAHRDAVADAVTGADPWDGPTIPPTGIMMV